MVIGYCMGNNMINDVIKSHADEKMAMHKPNWPKLNWPVTNVDRELVQRRKIGIKYDIWKPRVAMEIMLLKAVVETNCNSSSNESSIKTKNTIAIGVLVGLKIHLRPDENGNRPSLAKAKLE